MTEYLTPDEVRAEELGMLVEFDELCGRNGLRYSLAGGTLLGAVRHHGFIPWDDDIDVSMPRPDFEKLLRLAASGGLPSGRRVEAFSGDISKPVFVKYVNEGVAVDAHYENGTGRLWMDVTPVDGLPEDVGASADLFERAGKLQHTLMFCKADPHEGKTAARRLLKRFLVPLANAAGAPGRAAGELDSLARSFAFGETSCVGCVAWGLYGAGERYPLSGWNEPCRLGFEGHEVSAISCWDGYLSGLYGDYMQLPPEEKRVTHEMRAWYANE